jgi:hypothetical protein
MDDRSDLYRQDFIENHYLPVLRAESRWPQILDSHHVTSAVVTNGTPIARALSQSAAWSSDYQDEHVLLFLKNK